MALGPRLDLRQSQSLVMTPQLQQAIKLLALSNLEIEAFIGEALETNPLLEAGELSMERATTPDEVREEAPDDPTADQLIERGRGEADSPLDIDPDTLDRDRDTGDWSAQQSGGGFDDELPDISERADDEPTLAEYLEAQVGAAAPDPSTGFIARHLIGQLDEAGYLTLPLREVAGDLGVSLAEAELGLAVVQSLDPTGVGARTLSAYLSLPDEPPTREFVRWAHARGIRVLLPVSREDGLLDWAPYDGEDEEEDVVGMPTPSTELLGPIAINDADLIIVPAASVDRAGMRMGWGLGYFDKTLGSMEGCPPVYAVVFDDELVDSVPQDRHDMPVDGVVTPSGITAFR